MECWKCDYFYTSAKKNPCYDCENKNLFKLWESKQVTNKGDNKNEKYNKDDKVISEE